MGRKKGMTYDAYLPQVRVKSEMRKTFNVFMHLNKSLNLRERDESDLIRRIIETHPDFQLIEAAIITGNYSEICKRFETNIKAVERIVDACMSKKHPLYNPA